MTNKYLNMSIEEIQARWQDFANVIRMADKEKWPEITVLPEEAWALSRGISQWFHMYKIGVTFEVFPLRAELVDESVFHGIILELKRAYENDTSITLDRAAYTEFANCADELRMYSDIAVQVAKMYQISQEDGV